MLRIVAATRLDKASFEQRSLLFRSCARLPGDLSIHLAVAYQAAGPLPVVFNAGLQAAADEDTILFTHDDVWIDDWQLLARLEEALRQYAVVGVAGNRRRLPKQCSWAFGRQPGDWDAEFLSGSVAHVEDSMFGVMSYGPAPSRVQLIDGVFMAARVETLRRAHVAFDPRFGHHFYDLDFCRTCELAGLPIGTWPIAITHASGGAFGSVEWQQAYADYLAKWGE